jgi:hypothetical protein
VIKGKVIPMLKQNAMNMYGEVKAKPQRFLISAQIKMNGELLISDTCSHGKSPH